MAPGVIQNTELASPLNSVENSTYIEQLVVNKSCPIDHNEVNSDVPEIENDALLEFNGDVCKIEITKLDKKMPRKVTRPKVLKNVESKEYLYDRLYDTTCPRIVSFE